MHIPPQPVAPLNPHVLYGHATDTQFAMLPIRNETNTPTIPSAPAVTIPTEVDPAPDAVDNIAVGSECPTSAPIDTETEAKLNAEITKLWGEQRNGKAAVRRTRAELKALRHALAEKLHTMKTILARTGRGGGWASYLRSQKLPVATADRYVAEHAASLAAPEEKILTEELLEATAEEVRKLAKKMLPQLCRVLTTAELAFEFMDELFWNIPDAEGRETDQGLEVFRRSHEDVPEVNAPIAEVAGPVPAMP